jgi:enoyl-[acyl-carrier-protein] reductase (NADH)
VRCRLHCGLVIGYIELILKFINYREEEIGGTCVYLVSPAGYYTNGQVISVDGGHSLVNPGMR